MPKTQKPRPLNKILDLLKENYSTRTKYVQDGDPFEERKGLITTEGLTYETFKEAFDEGEEVSISFVYGAREEYLTEKVEGFNGTDNPFTYIDDKGLLVGVVVKKEKTRGFEGEVVALGKLRSKKGKLFKSDYSSGDFYAILSHKGYNEYNYNAGGEWYENTIRVECVDGEFRVPKDSGYLEP